MSPFVFPIQSFYDINGRPLVGGRLHSFETNSDTPQATYTNPEGTELNENPIVLNERGECRVYLDDTKLYRFVLEDALGNTIWLIDKISSASSGSGEGSPVSVDGTTGQIKVTSSVIGGVKHFIVGLSDTVTAFFADVQYNISQLVSALANKKDKQNPVAFVGSTIQTVTRIAQDANGRLDVDIEDVAFPDWTSAINEAVAVCEKTANKKNTLTGYESSTTAYPSIKAVVDFINSAMQNLGGKLITDNGDPFASSADLPSSTPYHGVDIADKDYAYIQGVGTAERWSATVSGSSVAWVQEYAISIPVFTPQQQAAIDSGVTSEMLGTFLTKTGDGSNVTATFTAAGSRTNISTGEKLSVIFGKIAKWFADLKAVAFSGSYNDLTNTPTIPTELPVKIEEIGGSAVDLDSLTASDMKVHYYTWSNGNRGNVSHKPTDAVYTVKVFPCGAGSAGTYVMQEAYKRGTTERYVRRRSDGGTAWSDWQLCTYADGTYNGMTVGSAATATHLNAYGEWVTWAPGEYDSTKPFAKIAEKAWSLSGNNGAGQQFQIEYNNIYFVRVRLNFRTQGSQGFTVHQVEVLESNITRAELEERILFNYFTYNSGANACIHIYVKFTGEWQNWRVRQLDAQSGDNGHENWVPFDFHNGRGAGVATPQGTQAEYVYPVDNALNSTSEKPVQNKVLNTAIEAKADKASSGNGSLAVIDSNGNYASSGISAYSQSQLNAAIENNVFPWLLDNSYVMTRSFWLTVTTSTTGKVMDFANLYTGEKLLRIGFNYVNDGDLQIYIPWNNAQWNQWIIETSGSSEVGYVFVTADGTKHSDNAGADTITPYFAQIESTLHSSGQSASVIGNYSIGTSTLYNTSSHYNFCIMLGNAESGKLVRLNLSAATKRYASGAKKAEIMVFATLDASGLND